MVRNLYQEFGIGQEVTGAETSAPAAGLPAPEARNLFKEFGIKQDASVSVSDAAIEPAEFTPSPPGQRRADLGLTRPVNQPVHRAQELPFYEEYILNPLQSGYQKGKQGVSTLMKEWGISGQESVEHGTRMAELQRKSERYSPSVADEEATQRVSEAGTVGEIAKELWDNPQVISNVALQSMGMFAPVLAATSAASMAGGPIATALSAGGGSYAVEYSQTIAQKLQESGMDPTDPKAWADALANKELMAEARESGHKRGISVGAFDAITAGVAGKLLSGAKPGLLSPVGRATGEVGLQAGGGMAGETTAQLADTGEISSLGEIALEGIAEGPTAIAEAPGNIAYARRQARDRAPPAVAQPAEDTAITAEPEVIEAVDVLKQDVPAEEYSPESAPANPAMAEAFGEAGIAQSEISPPPSKYFDNRLRRQNYRDELESMANSLTVGGDVQLVPDPNFTPGESDVRGEIPLIRTPSINPDWFQGMSQSPDLKMSVKEIGNAVKKAVAGERLGVRQARVVGAMLDQYQGERTSYENLEYARNQLDVARKARNSAGMPESQDWLFEENEYPADADGLTRTFMELHDQARQRGGEVLEQVEALLERQQSDEEILNAITAVLKGEQDGRQSTIGTEIDAQPPTEIQDTGQEPIAGEPAPGGLGEGSGIAPVDRPVETELDFQLAEQTESGLEEKEARAQNQTIAAKEQADRELLGFQLQGQVVEEPSVQMPLVEPVAQPVKKHPGKKLEAAKEEAGRRKRKTTGIAKERRSADKRRQDWAYRKEIDSMGPQEKEAVIKQLRHDAMVNKLSGLGSRMAWEGVEKKKNIASIDADSLKYVNDKLGNKVGDQLLVEIGKALGKEFGGDAYHVSGDEYWVHGDSRDDLVAGLEDVQKSLDEKTVVGPGGSMKGLGFSYGVSEDESQADRDMKTNKQTRTEAGDRVERGERPAGVKLKGDKQAIIKKKVLPKLKYARKKFADKESQNAYNKLVDRRKKLAKLLDCINR